MGRAERCVYSVSESMCRWGGVGRVSGWQVSVLRLDHPRHVHLSLRASGRGRGSGVGRRLCHGLNHRATIAVSYGRLFGARVKE